MSASGSLSGILPPAWASVGFPPPPPPTRAAAAEYLENGVQVPLHWTVSKTGREDVARIRSFIGAIRLMWAMEDAILEAEIITVCGEDFPR